MGKLCWIKHSPNAFRRLLLLKSMFPLIVIVSLVILSTERVEAQNLKDSAQWVKNQTAVNHENDTHDGVQNHSRAGWGFHTIYRTVRQTAQTVHDGTMAALQNASRAGAKGAEAVA